MDAYYSRIIWSHYNLPPAPSPVYLSLVHNPAYNLFYIAYNLSVSHRASMNIGGHWRARARPKSTAARVIVRDYRRWIVMRARSAYTSLCTHIDGLLSCGRRTRRPLKTGRVWIEMRLREVDTSLFRNKKKYFIRVLLAFPPPRKVIKFSTAIRVSFVR